MACERVGVCVRERVGARACVCVGIYTFMNVPHEHGGGERSARECGEYGERLGRTGFRLAPGVGVV